MALVIKDVTSTTGGPMLVPQGGSLLPRNGKPVVAEYLIAHWSLAAGPLPVSDVVVTAKVFPHDLNGITIWLAEVVFVDTPTKTYRCWRTFRIEMPNGQYAPILDDDIKTELMMRLVEN